MFHHLVVHFPLSSRLLVTLVLQAGIFRVFVVCCRSKLVVEGPRCCPAVESEIFWLHDEMWETWTCCNCRRLLVRVTGVGGVVVLESKLSCFHELVGSELKLIGSLRLSGNHFISLLDKIFTFSCICGNHTFSCSRWRGFLHPDDLNGLAESQLVLDF